MVIACGLASFPKVLVVSDNFLLSELFAKHLNQQSLTKLVMQLSSEEREESVQLIICHLGWR